MEKQKHDKIGKLKAFEMVVAYNKLEKREVNLGKSSGAGLENI